MTSAQIRELIESRPDGVGECDNCHSSRPLWTLPGENPGDFQWCRACLARLLVSRGRASLERAERRMPSEVKPSVPARVRQEVTINGKSLAETDPGFARDIGVTLDCAAREFADELQRTGGWSRSVRTDHGSGRPSSPSPGNGSTFRRDPSGKQVQTSTRRSS